MHRFPPLAGDVALDQKKEFHQCRIRSKGALGFSHFTQLAVEGFDGVGGIHHLADQVAIVKHQAQVVPVAPPAFDHLGVAFTPLLIQAIEGVFGPVAGGGLVDGFKVYHEVFAVRVGQVLLRVADLVDDAELDVGLRVDRPDGIYKARQVVYRGN